METGSNRLPELAARRRVEHEAAADSLKRDVLHAMAAGEGASSHVEWLIQRPFTAVDGWLGDDPWRRAQGMAEFPSAAKIAWIEFLGTHLEVLFEEVCAQLESTARQYGPGKSAKLNLPRQARRTRRA
jgi:hypothetical protein